MTASSRSEVASQPAQSAARIGGRSFPESAACVHCQAPIRGTRTLWGPALEHYDPDASFRDAVWTHCRLTTATLPTAPAGSERP